jgi:tetratricopeptide (TPR) repeat protein
MPEAYVNSGFALLGMKRLKEARDFFESATLLRRNQVNAYYGLAVVLEDMGDLEGALGAMRTFVHLAQADDPFRRKAESAIWEWQETLAGRMQKNARAR